MLILRSHAPRASRPLTGSPPIICASLALTSTSRASAISPARARATATSPTPDPHSTRTEREEAMQFQTTTLAAALLATVLASPAFAQNNNGPLVLAKSSYFFVGGKLDPSKAPRRS